MTENKEYTNMPQHQEEELEIDLMEYARKLWESRKLLLKVAGIAAVIGFIIAISIPKKFTAEVTLSPESGKSGGNSMAGMAAMLGLGNMNMGGGDANALNFSMAKDIVASTPFILEMLDTRVKTIDGEMDTTLVAYLPTQSVPWWKALVSLPGKTIGGIMSLFSDKSQEVEEEINPFQLTPKQLGQVGAIRSIIMAESDKKTGMTKLSVTVQDPLVAAMTVDTVLVKLQKFITKYKTSKAQEDYNDLKKLYEQRKKEYYEAQERYANYADANQNVILQRVKIEQERLQNEQALAFQVFNQVATQLEIARAKLQEEKPVFAVLEPASVPLYPTGTSKKIIILGIIFLAVAAASAWILFGEDLWNSLKEGLTEEKKEKE